MYWELELILFIFLLITAYIALEANDLLISVVMLTIFSFLMALLFTTMGAVDVGFTEAVVGAGVTGILLIVAIYQTTYKTED
ncbi:MAG: cation:proton antiporter [Balneola sp.]|jgi:multicomponent Na+:H+ antiporter subunit B|nr:cation:proton antiporter [Balneola sp.]MBE78829.1 cation:proton antiporter [Balneola sp.]HBX66317.1 cation:proton antiporter [Balneolaceae bacterium]|tara:strand:- start:101 stop:346 length:246 start_codon:yes stop_codon:yes gene_type:complete